MISPFGNAKEVVELLPVHNIKGTEVAEITKEVINFVQNCGFEVLCVVTDNQNLQHLNSFLLCTYTYTFVCTYVRLVLYMLQ